MKSNKLTVLFAGLTSAHYAIKSVVVDGNQFPARDARLDEFVGAKRIEWSFKDRNNFVWQALNNVLDPSITCGIDPKAPALKAPVRAGANVTYQWTDIVRHHDGPAISYLAAWPSVDTKPQAVDFFKIYELGYDKQRKKWANEDIIADGYRNTIQIPSDIKPGTYILRTDLLSLHGNGRIDGPQFYTHCFNVEVLGSGTATPPGVKFPGGYRANEPGVIQRLSGNAGENYIIPGPPKYAGKYEAPTGQPPVVTPAQKGIFPDAAFQAKYEALAKKYNDYTSAAAVFFDFEPGMGGLGAKSSSPSPKSNAGKGAFGAGANPLTFFSEHATQAAALAKERDVLRQDAIKLGYADPNAPTNAASQVF